MIISVEKHREEDHVLGVRTWEGWSYMLSKRDNEEEIVLMLEFRWRSERRVIVGWGVLTDNILKCDPTEQHIRSLRFLSAEKDYIPTKVFIPSICPKTVYIVMYIKYMYEYYWSLQGWRYIESFNGLNLNRLVWYMCR